MTARHYTEPVILSRKTHTQWGRITGAEWLEKEMERRGEKGQMCRVIPGPVYKEKSGSGTIVEYATGILIDEDASISNEYVSRSIK